MLNKTGSCLFSTIFNILMSNKSKKYFDSSELVVKLVAITVAANGIVILLGTLISSHVFNHGIRVNRISLSLTLIEGLLLLYFARLLSRRKIMAWYVTLGIYAFIILHNLFGIMISHHTHMNILLYIRNFALPMLILTGLLLSRKIFIVRSDIQSFASSVRFILLLLVITLAYGTAGFMLMDNHDFHQEIFFGDAVRNTIDQFGLLGNNLIPYTPRARLFVDSLSIVSLFAIFLAATSLFKPIKAKLIDQHKNILLMHDLLVNYPATSEDFFKLWPHDKDYYINKNHNAGLAYHPRNTSALVIGDPAGDENEFHGLLKEFDELCYVNDWNPVFVHVEEKYKQLYESFKLELQKLGEEAIINLNHFNTSVKGNKYFRNIDKRFKNAGYTYEILKAPHTGQVLSKLRQISHDWLKGPGRSERGLVMGYFSFAYMQQCNIIVAKDNKGTIMGFLNQVPSYDNQEANYDLLRHANGSLGNINDFLLMSFIAECTKQNYERLNLGLCPLSGINKHPNEEQKALDRLLNFAYSNGDRLYSFSGLRRFKAKYEPEWSPRYIGYRGGIIGFSKAISDLNKSWKVILKSR